MDPFIAGIVLTLAVLGFAYVVGKFHKARAARQQEIDNLEMKVISLEHDVSWNKRSIEALEQFVKDEHKEFRESFETAGDTVRLVHGDVALLSNHLGVMITSPSTCDRRVVIVPTSAKDATI